LSLRRSSLGLESFHFCISLPLSLGFSLSLSLSFCCCRSFRPSFSFLFTRLALFWQATNCPPPRDFARCPNPMEPTAPLGGEAIPRTTPRPLERLGSLDPAGVRGSGRGRRAHWQHAVAVELHEWRLVDWTKASDHVPQPRRPRWGDRCQPTA